MHHETVGGARLEHWSPEEARAAHARDEITLIDVRTPQEFAFEHIEGALLAPLATFQPRNLPGHTEKPLVFHCGSGVRSRSVAEACIAAGWSTVAHVEGGFAAWKAARLPYVAIDVATGAQRRVDPANA